MYIFKYNVYNCKMASRHFYLECVVGCSNLTMLDRTLDFSSQNFPPKYSQSQETAQATDFWLILNSSLF